MSIWRNTSAKTTPITTHFQVSDFSPASVGMEVASVVVSVTCTIVTPPIVLLMELSRPSWLYRTTCTRAVAGKTSTVKPRGIWMYTRTKSAEPFCAGYPGNKCTCSGVKSSVAVLLKVWKKKPSDVCLGKCLAHLLYYSSGNWVIQARSTHVVLPNSYNKANYSRIIIGSRPGLISNLNHTTILDNDSDQ